MSEGLRFVPPRVAFTDPRTGMITREWYLFLQGVFDRIGGATGASSSDLNASLFEDAGSGETNAMLFNVDQAFGQLPPAVALPVSEQGFDQAPPDAPLPPVDILLSELAELRSQVAELRKELDAVKQGSLI